MLNSTLEQIHEDVFECHHKHELFEHQLVRKKREIGNAEALQNTIRLVLGSEDP